MQYTRAESPVTVGTVVANGEAGLQARHAGVHAGILRPSRIHLRRRHKVVRMGRPLARRNRGLPLGDQFRQQRRPVRDAVDQDALMSGMRAFADGA